MDGNPRGNDSDLIAGTFSKDFATADLIRDLLKEQGITLEDRADGTGWRKD